MKSQTEHDMALSRINAIMKKGEDQITADEANELRKLAIEVQKYEKEKYIL